MRSQKKNNLGIVFDCNNAYYGEAFGIMRGLAIQRYGYFGPNNLDAFKDFGYGKPANVTHSKQNLKWWFSELCEEILEVERSLKVSMNMVKI